jgi:hypothetical protein
MKAVVIADSHGAQMGRYIQQIDRSWDVRVVKVGRVTPLLRDEFYARRAELQRFSPEVILLHAGHNDIRYHPLHNQHPVSNVECFRYSMRFMNELYALFPRSRVIYSSVFPRSRGPQMDLAQKKAYNGEADLFGRLVESACTREGREYTLNDVLWFKCDGGREHPVYFDEGGLHLSVLGKEAIAREWMTVMSTRQ